MADATTQPDSTGCGCCQPEPKSTHDVISELRSRRAAIEEKLRHLEPVGAR